MQKKRNRTRLILEFLQYLTKRYVFEIYRNGTTGEFNAILLNLIAKEYRLKFKTQDVVIPENPGPLFTMLAHKKELMVLPNGFSDPNVWYSFHETSTPGNVEEIFSDSHDKKNENSANSEKQKN